MKTRAVALIKADKRVCNNLPQSFKMFSLFHIITRRFCLSIEWVCCQRSQRCPKCRERMRRKRWLRVPKEWVRARVWCWNPHLHRRSRSTVRRRRFWTCASRQVQCDDMGRLGWEWGFQHQTLALTHSFGARSHLFLRILSLHLGHLWLR